MKGLLLAGGRGTRFRPLTFTGNKHLLPIANKPMLLYGLEHLREAGITEMAIILGPIKEGVVQTLGDGSKYDVNITYIEQTEPKGLAHAVLTAEDYLKGDSFVMYLGDNLLKQGVRPFLNVFQETAVDCVIGTAKVPNPSDYGVVVFNKDGGIERLVEKPRVPISDWALVGIYVFNDRIFDAARRIKPSWRGELEITDAIQTLFKSGARISVKKVQGWWKDTGKPEDLLEANQLVLQDLSHCNMGVVEETANVSNNVAIGQNTTIHKQTTVRGPVIIGNNCDIGPNAYIGPYTSIGDNVTIRNGEVENSIIMEGVHIDCGRRITDSIMGRNVRVQDYERVLPKGHRLILGDMAYVTL